MSLKHGLLGLLNYGAMTGYELKQAFNDSLSFFWQGQTSQIYRELSTMEKSGWLSSRQVIQTDKPNKRVYTITDAGKAELQHWLAEPESDIDAAMHLRSAFLMRVFFAGETEKAQALEMLKTFKARCLQAAIGLGAVPEAIMQYEAQLERKEQAEYWKLVALFGETYHKAMLEWADKAIKILEENK